MQNSRLFLRSISVILLQSFILQTVSFADTVKPFKENPLTTPTVSLEIPETIATIEDAYKSSDKTIYLLQDAHTNESAQYNLAKSLDIILKKENLKYVFTEAGIGDNSLSFLRPFRPLNERISLAKSYTKKGLLHGAEYLDLTSNHSFILWGVENPDLYIKTIEDYKHVAKERPRFDLYLKKIDATLDTLNNRLLNPSLQTFLKEYKLHHEDKLALTEYFQALLRESQIHNISLKEYPHLTKLKDLKDKEEKINFQLANEEHLKAVRSLPPDVQLELKEISQVKAGKMLQNKKEERAYFAYLESVIASEAKQSKLGQIASGTLSPRNDYPELKKYFSYLKDARDIQAKEILSELKALEEKVFESLSKTEDEKSLIKSQKTLSFLKKLFTFTLTPDEFKEYKASSFTLEHMTGFLNKKIMDLETYYDRSLFLEEGYEEMIKKAESFYALTYERDKHFLDKALSKMDQEGQTKAALITGGFHTTNLKEMLKQQNISYISITPQVLQETNIKKYESILLSQVQNLKTPNLSIKPSTSTAMTAALAAQAGIPAAQGARLAIEDLGNNNPKVAQVLEDMRESQSLELTAGGAKLASPAPSATQQNNQKILEMSLKDGFSVRVLYFPNGTMPEAALTDINKKDVVGKVTSVTLDTVVIEQDGQPQTIRMSSVEKVFTVLPLLSEAETTVNNLLETQEKIRAAVWFPFANGKYSLHIGERDSIRLNSIYKIEWVRPEGGSVARQNVYPGMDFGLFFKLAGLTPNTKIKIRYHDMDSSDWSSSAGFGPQVFQRATGESNVLNRLFARGSADELQFAIDILEGTKSDVDLRAVLIDAIMQRHSGVSKPSDPIEEIKIWRDKAKKGEPRTYEQADGRLARAGVHPATIEDLAEWVEFRNTYFENEVGLQSPEFDMQYYLLGIQSIVERRAPGELLIAREPKTGRVIGYTLLNVSGSNAEIAERAVHPDYRGKPLGSSQNKLSDELLDRALEVVSQSPLVDKVYLNDSSDREHKNPEGVYNPSLIARGFTAPRERLFGSYVKLITGARLAFTDLAEQAASKGWITEASLKNIRSWSGPAYASVHDQLNREFEAAGQDEAKWKQIDNAWYQNVIVGTAGMRGERGLGTNRINDFTIGQLMLAHALVVQSDRYTQMIKDADSSYDPTKEKKAVVLGGDSRHGSFDKVKRQPGRQIKLEALINVALGTRAYVYKLPASTPQLAWSVHELDVDAGYRLVSGSMSTASHNPKEHNGNKPYKVDGSQGSREFAAMITGELANATADKLAGLTYNGINILENMDAAFEAAVKNGDIQWVGGTQEDNYLDDAFQADELFVQRELQEAIHTIDALFDNKMLDLKTAKIVISPLYGVGRHILSKIIKARGLSADQIIWVEDQPDGDFPNVEGGKPNPEEPRARAAALRKAIEAGADLVLWMDPDADRPAVAVLRKPGQKPTSEADYILFNGNQQLALLMDYMVREIEDLAKQESVADDTTRSHLARQALKIASNWQRMMAASTVVSGDLMKVIARSAGIHVVETLTGFKYIGDEIEDRAKIIQKKAGITETEWQSLTTFEKISLGIEHSQAFIFGGEESLGSLTSDGPHDKDAIAGVMWFIEILGRLRKQGTTFEERMNEIYAKYGYFAEGFPLLTFGKIYDGVEFTEKDAMQIIKSPEGSSILNLFRNQTPKTIAGKRVIAVLDFDAQIANDPNGTFLFDADTASGLVTPVSTWVPQSFRDALNQIRIGSGINPEFANDARGIYSFRHETVPGSGKAGEKLPKENFIMLLLEDGSKIIVRPSGTEAILKDYINARGLIENRVQADAWIVAAAKELTALANQTARARYPERFAGARLTSAAAAVPAGILSAESIGYAKAHKEQINPNNENIVALYGASSVDISSALLFTNAPRMFFVDTDTPQYADLVSELESRWDRLEKNIELVHYQQTKLKLGYSSSSNLRDTVSMGAKALFELKLMGVKKEDIQISESSDGSVTLKFKWQYPGDPLKEYSVTFIKADIRKPSSYPTALTNVLKEKIHVYFQKAAFYTAASYRDFISTIADALVNGGWMATDDWFAQAIGPDRYEKAPLREILDEILTGQFQIVRSPEIDRYDQLTLEKRRPEARYGKFLGYGREITLNQKTGARLSSEAPIGFVGTIVLDRFIELRADQLDDIRAFFPTLIPGRSNSVTPKLMDKFLGSNFFKNLVNNKQVRSGIGGAINTPRVLVELGEEDIYSASVVGMDPIGDLLLEGLSKEGVSSDGIRRTNENLTSISLVFVEPSGDRTIVGAGGAREDLNDAEFNYLSGLLQKQPKPLLHIGYEASVSKDYFEKLSIRIKLLKDAVPNLTVVMDTSTDKKGYWPNNREAGLALLGVVDVFVSNLTDASIISGRTSPDDVIEWLLTRMKNGTVFIKNGERGSFVSSDHWLVNGQNEQVSFAYVPVLDSDLVAEYARKMEGGQQVKDSTGAGDAYAAGVLYGLRHGMSVTETASFGTVLGGLAFGQLGGGVVGRKGEAAREIYELYLQRHPAMRQTGARLADNSLSAIMRRLKAKGGIDVTVDESALVSRHQDPGLRELQMRTDAENTASIPAIHQGILKEIESGSLKLIGQESDEVIQKLVEKTRVWKAEGDLHTIIIGDGLNASAEALVGKLTSRTNWATQRQPGVSRIHFIEAPGISSLEGLLKSIPESERQKIRLVKIGELNAQSRAFVDALKERIPGVVAKEENDPALYNANTLPYLAAGLVDDGTQNFMAKMHQGASQRHAEWKSLKTTGRGKTFVGNYASYVMASTIARFGKTRQSLVAFWMYSTVFRLLSPWIAQMFNESMGSAKINMMFSGEWATQYWHSTMQSVRQAKGLNEELEKYGFMSIVMLFPHQTRDAVVGQAANYQYRGFGFRFFQAVARKALETALGKARRYFFGVDFMAETPEEIGAFLHTMQVAAIASGRMMGAKPGERVSLPDPVAEQPAVKAIPDGQVEVRQNILGVSGEGESTRLTGVLGEKVESELARGDETSLSQILSIMSLINKRVASKLLRPYRAGEAKDHLNPETIRKEMHFAQAAAQLLTNDTERKASGKRPIKRVYIKAIGGSTFGSIQADALGLTGGPETVDVTSIDPEEMNRILQDIETSEDPESIALLVISKSGVTTETDAVFSTIYEALVKRIMEFKKISKEDAQKIVKKQLLIITDAQTGKLREMIKAEGLRSVDHPVLIGGRWSMFSSVGLIYYFLKGGTEAGLLQALDQTRQWDNDLEKALEAIKSQDDALNPSKPQTSQARREAIRTVMNALSTVPGVWEGVLANLINQVGDRDTEVVVGLSDPYEQLVSHKNPGVAQIGAESLGKPGARYYRAAIYGWNALRHTWGRLLNNQRSNVTLFHERSSASSALERADQAAYEAVVQALTASAVPFMSVETNRMTPQNLLEVMFFEYRRLAVMAALYSPTDVSEEGQVGVEEYKKVINAFLLRVMKKVGQKLSSLVTGTTIPAVSPEEIETIAEVQMDLGWMDKEVGDIVGAVIKGNETTQGLLTEATIERLRSLPIHEIPAFISGFLLDRFSRDEISRVHMDGKVHNVHPGSGRYVIVANSMENHENLISHNANGTNFQVYKRVPGSYTGDLEWVADVRIVFGSDERVIISTRQGSQDYRLMGEEGHKHLVEHDRAGESNRIAFSEFGKTIAPGGLSSERPEGFWRYEEAVQRNLSTAIRFSDTQSGDYTLIEIKQGLFAAKVTWSEAVGLAYSAQSASGMAMFMSSEGMWHIVDNAERVLRESVVHEGGVLSQDQVYVYVGSPQSVKQVQAFMDYLIANNSEGNAAVLDAIASMERIPEDASFHLRGQILAWLLRLSEGIETIPYKSLDKESQMYKNIMEIKARVPRLLEKFKLGDVTKQLMEEYLRIDASTPAGLSERRERVEEFLILGFKNSLLRFNPNINEGEEMKLVYELEQKFIRTPSSKLLELIHNESGQYQESHRMLGTAIQDFKNTYEVNAKRKPRPEQVKIPEHDYTKGEPIADYLNTTAGIPEEVRKRFNLASNRMPPQAAAAYQKIVDVYLNPQRIDDIESDPDMMQLRVKQPKIFVQTPDGLFVKSLHEIRKFVEDNKFDPEVNPSGDVSSLLDSIFNPILLHYLKPLVSIIISEENKQVVKGSLKLGDGEPQLALLLDPIDGSSQVEVGGVFGMIAALALLPPDQDLAVPALRKTFNAREQVLGSFDMVFGFPRSLLRLVNRATISSDGQVQKGEVVQFELKDITGSPRQFLKSHTLDAMSKFEEGVEFHGFVPKVDGKKHKALGFAMGGAVVEMMEERGHGELMVVLQDLFGGHYLGYTGGLVADIGKLLAMDPSAIHGFGHSYAATNSHRHGRYRYWFELLHFALMFDILGGELSDGYQNMLDMPPAEPEKADDPSGAESESIFATPWVSKFELAFRSEFKKYFEEQKAQGRKPTPKERADWAKKFVERYAETTARVTSALVTFSNGTPGIAPKTKEEIRVAYMALKGNIYTVDFIRSAWTDIDLKKEYDKLFPGTGARLAARTGEPVTIANIPFRRITVDESLPWVIAPATLDERVIQDIIAAQAYNLDMFDAGEDNRGLLSKADLYRVGLERPIYQGALSFVTHPFYKPGIVEETQASFPNLKVISLFSRGTGNIDSAVAAKLGVQVTNIGPGLLNEAMAELIMANILETHFDLQNTVRAERGIHDVSIEELYLPTRAVSQLLLGELLRRVVRLDDMYEYGRSDRFHSASVADPIFHDQLAKKDLGKVKLGRSVGLAASGDTLRELARALKVFDVTEILYTAPASERLSHREEQELGLTFVPVASAFEMQSNYIVRAPESKIKIVRSGDHVVDAAHLFVDPLDKPKLSQSLHGWVFGIQSLGGISRPVAARAVALGMDVRVLVRDKSRVQIPKELEGRILLFQTGEEEKFFRGLEIVTPLADENPSSVNFINKQSLAMMPNLKLVVSANRGSFLNEAETAEYLETHPNVQVRMDVAVVEEAFYNQPLSKFPNVKNSGHNGSAVTDLRYAMMRAGAIDNLAAFFKGDPLVNPVNTLEPREFRGSRLAAASLFGRSIQRNAVDFLEQANPFIVRTVNAQESSFIANAGARMAIAFTPQQLVILNLRYQASSPNGKSVLVSTEGNEPRSIPLADAKIVKGLVSGSISPADAVMLYRGKNESLLAVLGEALTVNVERAVSIGQAVSLFPNLQTEPGAFDLRVMEIAAARRTTAYGKNITAFLEGTPQELAIANARLLALDALHPDLGILDTFIGQAKDGSSVIHLFNPDAAITFNKEHRYVSSQVNDEGQITADPTPLLAAIARTDLSGTLDSRIRESIEINTGEKIDPGVAKEMIQGEAPIPVYIRYALKTIMKLDWTTFRQAMKNTLSIVTAA